MEKQEPRLMQAVPPGECKRMELIGVEIQRNALWQSKNAILAFDLMTREDTIKNTKIFGSERPDVTKIYCGLQKFECVSVGDIWSREKVLATIGGDPQAST